MAKDRFIMRITDLDVEGNTFYRRALFNTIAGETVDRLIFWADHWAVNEQGWSDESPNNSWVQSITFTQGADTLPVPPTPPQPTGNPIFPGIIWYGSLPLTFVNWSTSGTASVNNQWLTTPAEGIETKGKRITAAGNAGAIWYQIAQYRHDLDIPFNIWSTRVTVMCVLLSAEGGFSPERKLELETMVANKAIEAGGQDF